MYDLLREYLAKYHKVSLPDIGTIGLINVAPRVDPSGKIYYPPQSEWTLIDKGYYEDPALIDFIAHKKNIATGKAKNELEDFCNDVKSNLKNSGEIKFPGIGVLKSNDEGLLQLEPALFNEPLFNRVNIDKIIHVEPQSLVLEEEEKEEEGIADTSESYLLSDIEVMPDDKWQIKALLLFFLSAGLIYYTFFQNNWDSRTLGNQQVITPQPAPEHVSEMFK
ncbi:MAG TPA: hypothetical protein VFN30_09280 [Chitinophagaceae bacterium]|nr:hypothetical protein [Chitinophagaceae bacterium]